MEGRINTPLFLNKSALDVATLPLSEWRQRFPALARAFDYTPLGIDPARYPQRALMYQANESDSAFLRRLLQRHGIAWFFRPGQARGEDDTPLHELVLFDDVMALPANAAGAIRYHRQAATEKKDSIFLLAPASRLTPGRVVRHSWDHETARCDRQEQHTLLDHGELGNDIAAALQDCQIEMPHAGDSWQDFERLTRLRIQHHEFAAAWPSANTTASKATRCSTACPRTSARSSPSACTTRAKTTCPRT